MRCLETRSYPDHEHEMRQMQAPDITRQTFTEYHACVERCVRFNERLEAWEDTQVGGEKLTLAHESGDCVGRRCGSGAAGARSKEDRGAGREDGTGAGSVPGAPPATNADQRQRRRREMWRRRRCAGGAPVAGEDLGVRGGELQGASGAGSVPGASPAAGAMHGARDIGRGGQGSSDEGAARRCMGGGAGPDEAGSKEDRGVRGAGCTSSSGAGSDPGAAPTAGEAHGERVSGSSRSGGAAGTGRREAGCEEGRGVRGASCTSSSGAGSDPGAAPRAGAAQGRARGGSSGRSAARKCSGGGAGPGERDAGDEEGRGVREAGCTRSSGAGSVPGALPAAGATRGARDSSRGGQGSRGRGAAGRCSVGGDGPSEREAGSEGVRSVRGDGCTSSSGAGSGPGAAPTASAARGRARSSSSGRSDARRCSGGARAAGVAVAAADQGAGETNRDGDGDAGSVLCNPPRVAAAPGRAREGDSSDGTAAPDGRGGEDAEDAAAAKNA